MSDRTVRSDIKEINGEHTSEVIRSKKGQGYFIDAGQPERTSPPQNPTSGRRSGMGHYPAGSILP
ncbi:MAG: hypothetical protein ACLTBV_33260 [Enterocloster bolteae]